MHHPAFPGMKYASGIVLATLLAACSSDDDHNEPDPGPEPTPTLACDDSLKENFKPDAETTVVAVKAFSKGDPLLLAGDPNERTPRADADVCMVKLMVGPGNPGPANAPSTSQGIGIEIWLPAKDAWNQRVHALGGGGWQGGHAGSPTAIANTRAASVAGIEGAVTSSTDTGHTVSNGSFAMNPDGSINQTLWRDFSVRGIYEQGVKTKALAAAYYGQEPAYAYWDGASTGGRQGLKFAQEHPDVFDGIVALYPAINWTRFITGELYPQIVLQRDLGGQALSAQQLNLVSNAAIAACGEVGGEALGYIPDPGSCTYDPVQDPEVICVADGGANATEHCVSPLQANAINKIWYGMTADGTVPDPAVDNGWQNVTRAALPDIGNWWGLTRGANLTRLAGAQGPFPIGSDMVALEMQDSRLATPAFENATGNGEDGWKDLSYAELANAYAQGVILQPQFAHINTDKPDLSAFKARGGKLLTWHGLADELIMPQGTINYYHRVAEAMGGFAQVQDFYRLYLVPGAGHGTPNGTSNPEADVPNFGPTQMYDMLTQWVEQGVAPGAARLSSAGGNSGLSCVYPAQAQYNGSGSPRDAASYSCR